MDSSGLPAGMMPSMNTSGILGLEMSLHQHPQHQHQHPQHQQMVSFSADPLLHPKQQPQPPSQQNPYGYVASKGKQQHHQHHHLGSGLSDEDEQALADDRASGDAHSGSGKCVPSPWQRMKWTDSMVRLLITMVYYVGDDSAAVAAAAEVDGKKKGGGGGVLQKKGKWKSVSRAMMEKGFYVSPQQCEDKFNDLNKRYKRVNEILGRGTACRVVENQNLLDAMDHLSPKMKEEARKLLNSKHLFFREMCAYHSNTAAAASVGTPHCQDADSSPYLPQQQRCLHSDSFTAPPRRDQVRDEEEAKEIEEEEEEEEDEDDSEDDGDEAEEGGIEQNHHRGHEAWSPASLKRQRQPSPPSVMQKLSCELLGILQDGTKSPREQRQWLQGRAVLLEERLLECQRQALELEKQRFKWLKFSGKKEREMERMKLDNERSRIESERMLLLLRQKEIEMDTNNARRSDLSSTG